jgi:hypothetical protein
MADRLVPGGTAVGDDVVVAVEDPVGEEIDGATLFSKLSLQDWVEHDRKELGAGPKNDYPLSFVTLLRRGGRP